jgi:3',5'-cyclic AMP phosphodiesterase CpdA
MCAMTVEPPLATFMLASDPQIGMYRASLDRAANNRARLAETGRTDAVFDGLPAIDGFERESVLFREAIAVANEVRPDALIVCGDIVQTWDDDAQRALALEVASELDADIPLHWVAGNHDVAPDTYAPTAEALERYRSAFGDDRYVVEMGGVRLIVFNSTAVHSDAMPAERDANLGFLESELAAAARAGQQPVACAHHPWFLRTVDEVAENPAVGMAIPPEPRHRLLEIAEAGGLRTLLTGHLHRHLVRQAGQLEQITTTSIGFPIARDPSGYRLVRVYEGHVEHEARALPSGPGLYDEATRIWAARQFQVE